MTSINYITYIHNLQNCGHSIMPATLVLRFGHLAPLSGNDYWHQTVDFFCLGLYLSILVHDLYMEYSFTAYLRASNDSDA